MEQDKQRELRSYGEPASVAEAEVSALEKQTGQAWTLTTPQVEAWLETNAESGLAHSAIGARLAEYGNNMLDEFKGISILKIAFRQICNAMTMVLFICMAISLGIRDWISGGVIGVVILLNVIVGFFQEYSAEKTMMALKELSSPTARVIRSGKDEIISAADLVPGDVIILKVGDTVPADGRLVTSMNLEADEALLTGESLPVAKSARELFEANTSVGDRINMCFASSTITKGRATAIVVSTGMRTEIGKIAESLKDGSGKTHRGAPQDGKDRPVLLDHAWAVAMALQDTVGAFLGTSTGTPLHQTLAKFSLILFGIAVVLAIVAMAAQKFNVTRQVAVYAIVVAISTIPASLVVVLTITMAVGARSMVRRHVVVRKLDSLEALGAVNDICSDKTGTLTQGKMVARKGWIPSFGIYEVTGARDPFDPTVGDVYFASSSDGSRALVSEVPNHEVAQKWILAASLANIATVRKNYNANTGTEVWKATGDPTEIAIQVFTCRLGYGRHELSEAPGAPYSLVAEYPFDSSIKRMSSVYSVRGTTQVFTKGAVERVLGICSKWYGTADKPFLQALDKQSCDVILREVDALTKEGLRVLAFAHRTHTEDTNWDGIKRVDVEKNLTFLGLIGIYDPLREESAAAVRLCHLAGINVHMLTGDHPGTARAIAQEAGILPPDMTKFAPDIIKSMVVTAPEFDAMSDEEIDRMPLLPLVIARCAPQTKVRMIEALHRRKAFTAMTGDGVNDSPSLKRADVGIAMGIAGSDVAKDVADIVLSDDNFASIAAAIEEGRRMGSNIQKFFVHLLAGNIAQVVFLVGGLGFKDALNVSVFPLSPVEVLWIIMVTASLPAMGLGQERAEPDIMRKPPRDPRKTIFTLEVVIDMFVYGFWLAVINVAVFLGIVYGSGSGELGTHCNETYSESCKWVFRARSCNFAVVVWSLLFLAWEIVDMRRSMFLMTPGACHPVRQFFRNIWSNPMLFWSVVGGVFSVFPIIYIPVINTEVFQHSEITWEWGLAVACTIIFLAGIEVWKWAKRVYLRHHAAEATECEDNATTIQLNHMHIATATRPEIA